MGEPSSRENHVTTLEPETAGPSENVFQGNSEQTPTRQLQDPEEILRLDNPQVSQDRQYLPGVLTERRFHRLHPDILIHNVLLRKLLREQASMEGMPEFGSLHANTSKITHGYACGDQNRLHTAVTIITEAVPGRLYSALVTQRKIRVSTGDLDYSGQDINVESGSKNHYDFPRPIIDVTVSSGEPSPVFLVRTEIDVYIVALAFSGEKRLAVVDVQIVYHINSNLLYGSCPNAVISTYTDHWTICVLTTNGLLRIWNTVAWPRTQPAMANFRLIKTIRLPSDPNFCQDIKFQSHENPDLILLIYPDKILSASTLSRTMQTLYIQGQNAKILKVKMLHFQSDDSIACIFTDRQLFVLNLKSPRVVLAEWNHYFTAVKAPRLYVCTSATTISVLLHSATLGLCCLYTVDLRDNCWVQNSAQRLPLDTKEGAACLKPYFLLLNSKLATLTVLGILYINCHNSVMHSLYGPDNVNVTLTRPQKILGPAVVRSAATKAKMETDQPEDDLSILHLNAWYEQLYRKAMIQHSANTHRPAQTAISRASCLSYEVLDYKLSSFMDFDAHLETLIQDQRDQAIGIDEVHGLRIYEDPAESADPESHTAYSITRMLRAWKGSQTRMNEVNHVHEQTISRSHEVAAISLAQAAIVLSSRTEGSSVLSAVTPVDDSEYTGKTSRALRNLLDDWNVTQEPSLYVWKSLDSNKDPATVQPFAVQEIPAFRRIPPVVASSQNLSSPGPGQQVPYSSQIVTQFASTQPVQGKFGDRKVKRKKKAGF